MEDWQETALTTRHMHNRVGKSKANATRKRQGGAFEVRKTFGRYEVKCPSVHRIQSGNESAKNSRKPLEPTLDIFRLSDDGRGLLGRLFFPGVLDVLLILTGSRKTLEELALNFEGRASEISGSKLNDDLESPEPQNESHFSANSDDESSDHPEKIDENLNLDAEERERQRFNNFEKNSFRSPKFWFQWQGQVEHTASPSDQKEQDGGKKETGRGYLVFSGNNCDSFKATISCNSLQWKDVSFSGWKKVTMSERDVPFEWV
ncbi:putative catalase [Colletotrichum truncatum]|uniref:Catalase n=1 Tax=Colletotrichum truncatum TaxID=5467 RepID=A0ACC3YUE3_COLTU|nr:putative catalase [Colletotrichum truncatum]KAF6780882.1 putative catalase [Colletotrichum truncatum]